MKVEKYLTKFAGEAPYQCPFCQHQLVRREGHNILYCPSESKRPQEDRKRYCPYFFELKEVWNPKQTINAVELTIHEAHCRVWIAKWKEPQVIKIGEHNHISCVLLPVKDADLSNMEKFIHRIKTIMTFQ